MRELNSKQVKYLRGLAHKLEPVVLIGQHGITGGVIKEIDATLKARELIKVKIRCDDQDELGLLLDTILESVKAEKIQVIGHTVVFYRRSLEPQIAVPGMPIPLAPEPERAAPKRMGASRARSSFGRQEKRSYSSSGSSRSYSSANKGSRRGTRQAAVFD